MLVHIYYVPASHACDKNLICIFQAKNIIYLQCFDYVYARFMTINFTIITIINLAKVIVVFVSTYPFQLVLRWLLWSISIIQQEEG